MKLKKIGLFLVIVSLLSTGCNNSKKKEIPETLTKIHFGMLPYGDHTYAIIGVQNGWFKDAGIEFTYDPIKIEQIIPFLKNKTMDVISCPPGILFASYDNAPDLCNFVFGDLFQGYAILAQPNSGLKSVDEFIISGKSYNDAIVATVQQMKGKKFAYPAEAAIKPFIDLVLQKGKLKRNQLRSMVLDDPLTINAMRNKQADFQVGGVPSRLVLQKEGFKPIISSIDLVKGARPSSDSKELSSILQNGWATTKEFYNNNHETILRLASVNYRIMEFINKMPNEAAAIHMPYLSKVSGQTFTNKDGEIIYKDLDPFVTFANQRPWFYDKTNPLYYEYVNGSILNNFISQGIYKSNTPKVNDVIFADDIYYELEKLKSSSEALLKKIQDQKLNEKNKQAKELFQKAQFQFGIYNYYDSERLCKELMKL